MTWARRGAAHVWTNCIVATLSHLAMGRVGVAPPYARAGAPQSPSQRAIWKNIYDQVGFFLREVQKVDGGAKLTKAGEDVAVLERLISAEVNLRNGYGDVDGLSRAFLGDSSDGLAPLVAEHVALPARGGFFDPRSYLSDPEVLEAYDDPDALLAGGDASGEAASKGVPRTSGLRDGELIALCKRLDAAGILALF